MRIEHQVNIYTLNCPITGEVKYIGKTIKPVEKRLTEHLSDLRGYDKRKNWLRMLKLMGLKPYVEILDCVDSAEWAFWESYWICQFRAWGFNLKNQTIGGEGASGRFVSEKTRQKISIAHKGRKHSLEHVRNAVKGRMDSSGFKSTVQSRHKQSIALLGKPKTEAHRAKLALNKKGIKWSSERRLAKSNKMKGKTPIHVLKPVIGIDKNGKAFYFDSIQNACNYFGILGSSISNCLKLKAKTAGGLKWTYQNKSVR